jgi:hypothetical protein
MKLDDYVNHVRPEKVEEWLWKEAFEGDGISGLCKELGWQGGTIHLVLAEILKRQANSKV